MSRFGNGNILSTLSLFIRQFKMNIQNFCLFVIFVSAVMFGAILIGFKTLMTLSIWRCIWTHIFFWLNTEKNADPYINKAPNLSSTRKCDKEPHDTLFSWFGLMLFLLHQSNNIDHSIYVKTKRHVYMCIKKTKAKLSSPSNCSLDKWKRMSFIFVFYPFSFTS